MNISREPERWIDRFLEGHKARFEKGWPTDSGEMNEWKRGWVRAFRRHAVSLKEATNASADLAPRPPKIREDHIPRVIELIYEARHKETGKHQAAYGSEAARIRAEAAQAKAEQARAEAAWNRLPEEQRREYVARAEANHPHLTRWPRLIQQIAVDAMMSAREPEPAARRAP